ncbi:protein OXIDATIVE STRESS 3 LIKE 2-like [Salvia divinorum]|uniref:Protein OXIDATIVE STRESS 3 LIKE 2-like n=1 Tax=Salvia divinorum TaxID=28513 RepID=A0ABD1FLC0_SALDI
MPTRVMSKVGVEDEIFGGDERFFVGKKVMFKDVREEGVKFGVLKNSSWSDESSSSIGKNSDLSENSLEKSGDGEEVQSSYKGPLDAMEALEEVLPIRRGISRFYNGKSKSFASLGDASSIKEVAKPENAYTRKRRNMVATNLPSPLRGNGGAISKRVTTSATARTTLALAVAMSNSESECNSPGSSSSPRKKDLSAWRSFSLADLQHCAAVAIFNSNSNVMTVKPSG